MKIQQAINKTKNEFMYLWNNNASIYDFFELAKKIDKLLSKYNKVGLYGGKFNFQTFEKGWQYRNVLSEDFQYSFQNEWYSLLIGWF